MSNFISEDERREELYGVYSNRHGKVLDAFKKISASYSNDNHIISSLSQSGIDNDEIDWLKRTGHYFPKIKK